jgi:hypothetical protein
MFFSQMAFAHFSEEVERRRRRQAKGQENFLAGDTLKLSEYGCQWKRAPLPSYTSYDTGKFGIIPRLPETLKSQDAQTYSFTSADRHLHSVTK